MNPATLTTSTFTLVQQGQTTPLAASVSYASQVATLDPSADLAASTTYTATVKGGSARRQGRRRQRARRRRELELHDRCAGNQPPTPVIDTPTAGTTWKVGDTISFTGHATDPEQGTLPASALSWRLLIQHCPSNCHSHTIQTWPGVAGGSFAAPDHEYPSYLDLELTATDAGGASQTTTRRLDPQTVVLTFASSPVRAAAFGQRDRAGDAVHADGHRRLVELAQRPLAAVDREAPRTSFASWSDGGAPDAQHHRPGVRGDVHRDVHPVGRLDAPPTSPISP